METQHPIVFRKALVADSREIAQVHVHSWRQAYRDVLSPSMLASLSIDGRESTWRSILSQPSEFDNSIVFLALDGTRVCGFSCCGDQRTASLKDKGYSGEVSSIYVIENYQMQGIGKKLLWQAFEALSKVQKRGVGIWVLSENFRAREFYERRGGQQVAQRTEIRASTTLTEIAYGWIL